jgi:hypothetical protein
MSRDWNSNCARELLVYLDLFFMWNFSAWFLKNLFIRIQDFRQFLVLFMAIENLLCLILIDLKLVWNYLVYLGWIVCRVGHRLQLLNSFCCIKKILEGLLEQISIYFLDFIFRFRYFVNYPRIQILRSIGYWDPKNFGLNKYIPWLFQVLIKYF